MLTPAKINLYLEILGKRPDGYHEIRTVFLPLFGLTDTIHVERHTVSGIELSCTGLCVPAGEDNLCWRAAMAFCQHFQRVPQYRILLEKRIPIAAGLGGGSSDAAAVLLSLLALEKLEERKAELYRLAAELGADIPFFLDPRPALGEGKGERLSTLNISQSLELLLINPGFPVPVSWSYQHAFRPEGNSPPDFQKLIKILTQGSPEDIATVPWNDLEFAVFRKFPILELIRRRLLEAGALTVHVSGSGPTLFALCKPGTRETLQQLLFAEFGEFATVFRV